MGLTSTGVGSGLDIESLVSQLMEAEKAPRQTQITRAQTSTVTTLSAISQLKSAMSTFNDALSSFTSVEEFAARSASTSDDEIFTASATSSAMPGTYDIEVEKLATAHQISSNAFEDGASQEVGTGTLTISRGDSSFSISVDSEHSTLAEIRDAINDAEDNNGMVTATIVNASDGAHLVLSSSKTGAENALTVSQEGGDGGLSSLTYSSTDTANYSERAKAQDAVVYIAGYAYNSATNSISDAIDGVTIDLKEAADDDVQTLTIYNDTSAVANRAQEFVDAYNDLESTIASLRSYDSASDSAGALLGDAMLRAIESELRSKLSNPVSGLDGAYDSLASIGITTQKDGTLELDSDKFDAALEADFDGVAQLFGSENGVATRLSDALDARLESGGQIDQRTDALNAKSEALDKEQEDLDARMEKIEARYRAQFNALDTLLAELQNTSDYLDTQLESIANIGKDD